MLLNAVANLQDCHQGIDRDALVDTKTKVLVERSLLFFELNSDSVLLLTRPIPGAKCLVVSAVVPPPTNEQSTRMASNAPAGK